MRARDLMTAPVITVQPWTSAKEAAELLSTHGFSALPVVDDDDPDRHVAQLPAPAVPGVVTADTAYAGQEQTR